MKKLFKMVSPDHQSADSQTARENNNDEGFAIVTIGRIDDVTRGGSGPKTDDPNKWTEKE
jgi:hypothetical protein